MLIAFHIDKIDNDDAAQISESKLAGYGLRRFQIGFEYSLFQIAAADIAAGIYIHGGHRFGLVKYQITARF